MACEVGNIKMVKIVLFRAIIIRFIMFHGFGLSRVARTISPNPIPNLNRVYKTEPSPTHITKR